MSNGTEIEPLLIPDDDRFVVLPVKYQDLYQMYKSAVACFWTAEEVDLSKDLNDWVKMTKDEKHFYQFDSGVLCVFLYHFSFRSV
jgi:ribonucleoside-diphosphate reductase subunit M2